jgi:hypothetical protein
MDDALQEALQQILDMAYPEAWTAAWLLLPLDGSGLPLQVVCSDLPRIRAGVSSWPPSSRDSKVWLRWEPRPGNGFWIRPRQYNPILRDRFILLGPNEVVESRRRESISYQGLLDACLFAAASGRVVWHNPPKGGARSPESAHFQSMPLFRNAGPMQQYVFPCCAYESGPEPGTSAQQATARLLGCTGRKPDYPVLGLVAWGPPGALTDLVWELIWRYDEARACNLVIQPVVDANLVEVVRIFVFPRARAVPRYKVVPELLQDDEQLLMTNREGGMWGDWSFAGAEMGLLTQVEWGGLFEAMGSEPEKWGRTLFRLLRNLTLRADEEDWSAFRSLCEDLGLIRPP